MLFKLTATTGTNMVDLSEVAFNGSLAQGINSIDCLKFSVPRGISLLPMKTIIELLRNDEPIFYGRVIRPEPSMGTDGTVIDVVTCEGQIGVLHDSVQPYTEPRLYEDTATQSGIAAYLDFLLSVHNQQVEDDKRVYLGDVSVKTNEGNNQVYKGTQWQSTWDTIIDKLVNVYGGELRMRRSGDLWLLDYKERIGNLRNTTISLGVNQQNLTRTIDASAVITRLYPLGCKLTKKDLDGNEEQTDERLTISESSFSAGSAFIDSQTGIETFGLQSGTVVFDDITDADNLYRAGVNWLANQNNLVDSYSVGAVDLSLIAGEYDTFQVGDWYPVINGALGITADLEVVAMTTDLSQPWTPSVTLGSKSMTLNDYVNGGVSAAARAEIDKAISSNNIGSNAISSALQTIVRDNQEAMQMAVTRTEAMSTAFVIDENGNEADLLFDKILVTTNGTEETRERATAFIRFIDGNILLGKSENPTTLTLQNDRLSFNQGGIEVAYMSNNRLHITDASFAVGLQIGKFSFQPRDNGNLTFRKVKN